MPRGHVSPRQLVSQQQQKEAKKKERKKELKSYLRSTMGQERLSSLALTFIHRNVQVDVDAVVKEFARKQPRRIILPDILFEEA